MKERDTYRDQFHAQERKVLDLTKKLHEERGLNDYLGTKRKHPWEVLISFLDLFLIVTPKRNFKPSKSANKFFVYFGMQI